MEDKDGDKCNWWPMKKFIDAINAIEIDFIEQVISYM